MLWRTTIDAVIRGERPVRFDIARRDVAQFMQAKNDHYLVGHAVREMTRAAWWWWCEAVEQPFILVLVGHHYAMVRLDLLPARHSGGRLYLDPPWIDEIRDVFNRYVIPGGAVCVGRRVAECTRIRAEHAHEVAHELWQIVCRSVDTLTVGKWLAPQGINQRKADTIDAVIRRGHQTKFALTPTQLAELERAKRVNYLRMYGFQNDLRTAWWWRCLFYFQPFVLVELGSEYANVRLDMFTTKDSLNEKTLGIIAAKWVKRCIARHTESGVEVAISPWMVDCVGVPRDHAEVVAAGLWQIVVNLYQRHRNWIPDWARLYVAPAPESAEQWPAQEDKEGSKDWDWDDEEDEEGNSSESLGRIGAKLLRMLEGERPVRTAGGGVSEPPGELGSLGASLMEMLKRTRSDEP